MIRLVTGLLIAGMTYACQAQVYVAQFPPNPGVMPGGGWQYSPGSNFGDPPGPRAWTNGKYGGVPEFRATDLYRLPGPTGPLNAQVVSAAGLRGAALAVGRCVVGLNPICAAGTAAWMVYDKYRARPVTGDTSQVCGGVPCNFPSGQFDYDPGQEPSGGGMTKNYCISGQGVSGCNTDPVALAQSNLNSWATNYSGVGPSWCTNPANGNGSLTWYFTQSGNQTYQTGAVSLTVQYICGGGGQQRNISSPGEVPVDGVCPPSVDALDPAYSIPGGQPRGYDGKCPSGRHNHVPKTPEELADIVNGYPPELPNADWGRAVSDAIDLGGQKAPASLTGSGPSQTTGAPQTTQTPTPGGGTTTTTTTGTTNYTYNNTTNNYPSITYATTNNYTTNTCTATGTCNTSSGSNPGPTSGTPAQDPTDPCVKNPTALQCIKLGEPGTEKPSWETKNIVYTPEAVDLPSQCPAPWTGSFKGKPWVVSFTPACDQAWIIKAALLSIVGFGCMLLLSREVS